MSENQINEPGPGPTPQPDGPRRLLRSRRDRMLAGVAGGLGEYFGVDPVIVRIAFAVSIFFGGLGALVYVALALFVPSAPAVAGEQAVPAPAERSRGLAIAAGAAVLIIVLSWGVFDLGGGLFFGWGPFWLGPPLLLLAAIALVVWVVRGAGGAGPATVLGRIALALGALVALSLIALASAWAAATGHGAVIASVIIAIGALLVIAAFRGGARWLVIPALALAAPLGVVAATDVSFGDGIGEREYRPTSVAELPEGGYELGVGRLLVDLRDLDWRPDTAVELNVDLGVGEAVIGVPSDVCVSADVESVAGAIRVAGDDQDGVDIESETKLGATATPRLDLTGQVDVGALHVINADHAPIDDLHDLDLRRLRDRFRGGSSDAAMSTALDRACEDTPPRDGEASDGDRDPGPRGGGDGAAGGDSVRGGGHDRGESP